MIGFQQVSDSSSGLKRIKKTLPGVKTGAVLLYCSAALIMEFEKLELTLSKQILQKLYFLDAL